MGKLPASHGDVYATVLTAYEDEYKDLVETWRSLETKAQGAAAIGGVFLAAGATLSKTLLTDSSIWARLLFVPSFVLLILAIGYSVRALRVRKDAPRRPGGQKISKYAGPVLRAPEQALVTGGPKFLHDQLEVWQNTTAELAEDLQKKASAVNVAQTLLFWAAFAFAVYAVVAILGGT